MSDDHHHYRHHTAPHNHPRSDEDGNEDDVYVHPSYAYRPHARTHNKTEEDLYATGDSGPTTDSRSEGDDRGYGDDDGASVVHRPELHPPYRGFKAIYYNPVIQVFFLGFVCFMGPGLFNALNGLGGGGMVDPTTSANANSTLYATFAVAAFFAGCVFLHCSGD